MSIESTRRHKLNKKISLWAEEDTSKNNKHRTQQQQHTSISTYIHTNITIGKRWKRLVYYRADSENRQIFVAPAEVNENIVFVYPIIFLAGVLVGQAGERSHTEQKQIDTTTDYQQ